MYTEAGQSCICVGSVQAGLMRIEAILVLIAMATRVRVLGRMLRRVSDKILQARTGHTALGANAMG